MKKDYLSARNEYFLINFLDDTAYYAFTKEIFYVVRCKVIDDRIEEE